MTDADVTWEVTGRVGVLTLQRPKVNAFATGTWQALDVALASLAGHDRMSAVVLRSGLPTIFSAGADVTELPMTPAVDEARQALTRRVLASVVAFPVPIVCAVPGPALGGGCALAAACDIRLATRSARFGLPEIDVGRCGGARHLMRHLPQSVVRHAAFTGKPISAIDAHRLGFVSELFDTADELDEAALDLAADIAGKSPTAVRLAKQSLDLAEELPLLPGYAVEQQFSLRLARTDDAAEAALAFREQRPPRWTED
ncbi:MAG: enoyl-CoA hydratase/isomerase family protein [Actinobacteria bacterium]|nr:enoyl-CoA hydratase/isomerase family protein [Actinomycetota bacterium]